MVREKTSARDPLQPSQGRIQSQSTDMDKANLQRPTSPARNLVAAEIDLTSSPQPVFGLPTALGASPQPFARMQPRQPISNTGSQRQGNGQRDPYSNLFVHRPQLHKPSGGGNPLLQLNKPATVPKQPQQANTSVPYVPTARNNQSGFKPLPQRDFDDDFFHIPKAPTWRPNAPTHATFSSQQNTNPFVKPKTDFLDMAVLDHGMSTNASIWENQYISADPNDYIDTAKANEQLKALFEGGIEDDDDKPRTRQRKKVIEAELDNLTGQMNALGVRVRKNEDQGAQSEQGKEEEKEDEEDVEEEDDGTREGLKVKLLPHQIDGVEWMRTKELGRKNGKGRTGGGILADDMGLGKTIQSIALILSNPKSKSAPKKDGEPGPVSKYDKGTLVVAPLALIKQWEGEIKDRIDQEHALKVCVHHGPKRTKSYKDLRQYDVVITTYSTLSSEHAATNGKLPVGCYGVKWHRLILDEAHSIKNRNAKSTKAACGLEAQYKWCLTGTPMQNNLDELQSLIHFLRIAPLDKLEYWRDQITRPMSTGRGGLAIKRLQAVLRNIMKRRTKEVLKQSGGLKGEEKEKTNKTSTEFRLVKRTVEAIEADFTAPERAFYQRLESRTDQRLEMMMAGNKMSYASALVLLMRLRQACNHPRLIGGELTIDKDSFADSGSQTPREKGTAATDDADDLVAMLGGLTVKTKLCDVCQVELGEGQVRNGDLRCDECEKDLAEQEAFGEDKKLKKKDKQALLQSDRLIKNRRVIVDSDDEDEDDAAEEPEPERKHVNTTSSDIDEEEDEEEEETSSDEESSYESDEATAADLISSTKIRRLLSILRADAHSHKYIVFSVFTSMLDLIEPFLQQSHIKFVRYDGSMRNDLREASLEKLRTDTTVRVLLCSLRAGSLGLNLTAASRVVVLEPFWNPFVEEQAIDRVHRLNQTQDVVVYKMTIKDTVESRILELQEKKRALAKATIEGHKSSGVAKLTMAEMLKLFDHKAERNAKVDMLGMADRRGLLVDGESTEESASTIGVIDALPHAGASRHANQTGSGGVSSYRQHDQQEPRRQDSDRERERHRDNRPNDQQRQPKAKNEIYSRRW